MAAGNTQLKHDTMMLNELGYTQELFREMGWFSNFAIAFSTISCRPRRQLFTLFKR